MTPSRRIPPQLQLRDEEKLANSKAMSTSQFASSRRSQRV